MVQSGWSCQIPGDCAESFWRNRQCPSGCLLCPVHAFFADGSGTNTMAPQLQPDEEAGIDEWHCQLWVADSPRAGLRDAD